jgi:sugar phosphate permease
LLQVSVLGKRQTVFYGWVIVGVGVFLQMIHNGVGGQGLGAFLVPLESQFGWSKGALAGGRSLMQLENGLLGPLEGWIVDRFGPKVVMVAGIVIFGSGMVLLGFINSLWGYYGAYVVIAIGASLSGSISMFVALNNWFQRKRTLAMGLTQTGSGFAGIIVVPLLLLALATWDWRTAAIVTGIVVWIVGIPAGMLIRRAPEQYGALPDGEPIADISTGMQDATGSHGSYDPSGDFTLKEALRTRSFWFIGLGHGMAVLIISSVSVHQFAHVEQGVGLSQADAAMMIGVLGLTTVFGRILGGILGDRGDMRYLAAGAMIGTSISLAIFALATALWHTLLFGAMYGLFWGMRGPMMSSIRGQYFGRTSFGTIMGTSAIITTACAMVGPLFAGVLADIQGDYVQGFLILAVVSGLGSVFFLMTERPTLPPSSSVRPAER